MSSIQIKWNDEEIKILKENKNINELVNLLPNRTKRAIRHKLSRMHIPIKKIYRKDFIKKWVENEQSKHRKCRCGCGKEIIILNQHYYLGIPKFKKGHYAKDDSVNIKPLIIPPQSEEIVEEFKKGKTIKEIIEMFGYSVKVIKRILCNAIGKEEMIKIIKEGQKERAIKNLGNRIKLLPSDVLIALKNDFEIKRLTSKELEKKYKISQLPLRRLLIEQIGEEKYNMIVKEQRKKILDESQKDYWEKWRKRRADILWDLEGDFDWNRIYENLDRFEEVELSDDHILIDSNERNKFIIEHLGGIRKRLWICDYYIYGNPHILIERKTVNDLYQSMIDGRLWNQLKMMEIFPSYPTVIFPAILVEGKYNDANWRIKKRFKEWQFENLLNIIRFKWQTAVIQSKDAKNTVSILKAIQYAVKPKKKSGKRFYITPIKKKDKSSVEIRIAILMTIEGVGENTAIKLLQKYGTIGNMLIASKTPGDDKILQRMDKLYRN